MSRPDNSSTGLNPALKQWPLYQPVELEDLVYRLTSGDISALSKAITLMESTRRQDFEQKINLFAALESQETAGKLRLAVSGAPGTGKSTLINALANHWALQGKRLAILAVDPSSITSGGSLLGDKTRMENLHSHERVFVRPSPSRGHLGGVTPHTMENLRLCEAAGYDLTIIETVGVGQSEVEVRDMVDLVVLVLAPFSGDELQGIKRGIVEIADFIVVNKSDGLQQAQAKNTTDAYRQALQYLHRNILVCETSALEGHGIDYLAAEITSRFEDGWRRGEIPAQRQQQIARRFNALFNQHAVTAVRNHPAAENIIQRYIQDIDHQTISPELAALRCWQEIISVWTGA